MNRYIIGFIIFLIVLAGIVVFLASRNGSFLGSKATATIGEQKISLKIAATEKERQIGLSETKSLGANEGMLFLFDTPAIYSFWMKDMDFPIDIIFLNENKVVTIHKNVPAPKSESERLPIYQSTQAANRVLELKAGNVDKLGIKEGDALSISL